MNDNSRLAKNTIFLYVRMFAVMAIGIFTSRIVLKNLGIIDYGLYNVVGGVAVMFVFINSAMNSATQRYLSVAIGKADEEYLHKVFNVSSIIHFIIGIIIIILCEIVGLWFIYYKMTIPEGREMAVMWAFQLSIVSVFVSMISIPYNALIISRERMGVFAYITIFDVFYRLFVAYIISVIRFDHLIIYAILSLLSPILTRIMYVIYCKKHFKETTFKFYKFDGLYKEMTIFASWGLLGHFSCIINSSIQNMMLNVYFSPVINAARAIAVTVSTKVEEFNNNFQMAVSPQITKSWAVGDSVRVFHLIYNSSRFSLYLMWFLSLPLMICMDDILHLWLVEVPDKTELFLRLVLCDVLINSIMNPLNMAIRAKGEIKYPELTGGLMLIMNLPISFIFLNLGYGPQCVFIIMIVCDILTHVLRVYFAHRYLKMPIRDYLRKVIFLPILIMLISSVIPILSLSFLNFQYRLQNLLFFGSLSMFSVLFFVYFVGINNQEKCYFKSVIKSRIKIW